MRKSIVFSVLVASSAAGLVAACSSDNSVTEGGGDGGADGSTRVDGGHEAGNPPPVDGGTDTGMNPVDGNMPPVDGNMPVDAGTDAPPVRTGTQLVTGQFTVFGVTTDGYIIYTDTSGNAFALALGGGADAGADAGSGTPQAIATGLNQYGIGVVGKTVLIWNTINSSSIGALSTWTEAKGYTSGVAAASVFGLATPTADGTAIMFSTNAVAGATDIAGANVDGTSKVTIVPAAVNSAACAPFFAFFGGTVPVVGSCVGAGIPTDGGAATGSITKYSGAPSWTPTPLLTPALAPFRISGDSAGTQIFTTKPDQTGIVISLGATPTTKTIDTTVYAGLLTSDGTAAVYGTQNGDLKRSPTGTPLPTLLIGSVNGFYNSGLSSNGATLLCFTAADQTTGFTDLAFANAAASASLRQITATTNAAIGWNGNTAAFTKDDSYALWGDTYDMNFLGTLHATSVAGVVTTNLGTGIYSNFALTGTKVAFNANTQLTPATPTPVLNLGSTADIMVVDTAAAAAPTTLATQADVLFAPTPSLDKLVYTFNGMPTTARGLYIVNVP